MHTFAQRLFFMFGLRRRMATRRTPVALQVDQAQTGYLGYFRGPQRPCRFRIGTEVRDGGFQYVKPLAAEPRTA